MTTVIVGGAGFVGLNIAEALLTAGREVVIADLASPPGTMLARLPGGDAPFVTVDVTDPQTIREVIRPGIDSVVFGAAITADAERDAAEPELVLGVNLLGFVNVLRAARDAGVRRVVNLSSASAYGDAAFDTDLVDEASCQPRPSTLYALSKFGTECAGRRLAALWDLDVRSVRLSAVFGRFEYRTAARDTPSVLMQIAAAAREGRPAVLSRPGMRDWTYGSDVAGAIRSLLFAGSPAYDLYNIASGQSYSALDWGQALAARVPGFECCLAASGEEPTVDLHDTRDRSPMAIERLTTDLKFQPSFGLDRSVADYWRWLSA